MTQPQPKIYCDCGESEYWCMKGCSMTLPSDRERIDGDIQLTAFFLQAHPDADIEAVLAELVKPLLDRLAAVEADREYNARLVEQAASALMGLQRAVRELSQEMTEFGKIRQREGLPVYYIVEWVDKLKAALLPDPAGTTPPTEDEKTLARGGTTGDR